MSLELPNIDLSGVNESMGNLNASLEKFAEDIQKRKDNAMAMEFTRVICDLLKENGVTVQMVETQEENHATNKFEVKCGVRFTGIDFSEHDKKVAEEKDKRIQKLEMQIGDYRARNMLLRQRCKGEAVEFFDRNMFDSLIISSLPLEDGKRISELEDRHQSDCIEINRLHTALEVMTEKYMKLREVYRL